ncbi:hypothetical protein [Paraburkholderia xenovorans]
MVLFFCPTGGWKMATIAEFLFIRLSRDSGFSPFADKWKNVSFFATGVMRGRHLDFIGVLWKLDATVCCVAGRQRTRAIWSLTDCGDAEIFNIRTSFMEYPAINIDSQAPAFFGGNTGNTRLNQYKIK